ncbi:hypothetical protein [Paraburkholderia unamae]|uniref:Uncharacterized protein n=1 Tax=Paraburkholderia unamae TaxID=219649 RepID=A0ACC6RLP9_9BURK
MFLPTWLARRVPCSVPRAPDVRFAGRISPPDAGRMKCAPIESILPIIAANPSLRRNFAAIGDAAMRRESAMAQIRSNWQKTTPSVD